MDELTTGYDTRAHRDSTDDLRESGKKSRGMGRSDAPQVSENMYQKSFWTEVERNDPWQLETNPRGHKSNKIIKKKWLEQLRK